MTPLRPLLEPGTRVVRRPPPGRPRYSATDPHHHGVVELYQMGLKTNLGWFPIRWRSGVTSTHSADEVIIEAEAASHESAA